MQLPILKLCFRKHIQSNLRFAVAPFLSVPPIAVTLGSRASLTLNLMAGVLRICMNALFWFRRMLMCSSFMTSGEFVGLGMNPVEKGRLYWVWILF